MNKRLKDLRKHLGLSQKEFGEKIFIDQTHVSSLESGRREITPRLIKDICLTFAVNEEWLKTGKDDMMIDLIDKLDVDDEIKGLLRKMVSLNPGDRSRMDKILDSFISE